MIYSFSMAIAIVSGALANKPGNGGNAWTRLQWVLGLRKLGIQTYFVEQIARDACVDRTGALADFSSSVNLAFFKDVMEGFGLGASSSLVYDNGEEIHGLSLGQLEQLASASSLFINISGHLTFAPVRDRLRCRVYFDDDPAYTQFWYAAGNAGPRLEGHDFYYTIGGNIDAKDCVIPTGGLPWRTMRPLIVLEHWPVSSEGDHNRFTTVASWRGPYGPIEHEGQTYGLKVHEFRKFIELPERVPLTFEIALNIHPADARDRAALIQHGWRLADPQIATSTTDAYRRYLQLSGAEFSASQGIYVQTNSGWFSDRTACYLACGKPALVQDTGFSRQLPVGAGLLTFRTLEEAIAGARQIAANYEQHAQSARALAEAHFDSNKVLGRLLEEVGVSPV
jgi:hypothetical protein